MKFFNFFIGRETHLGIVGENNKCVDANACGYPVQMMDIVHEYGKHRQNLMGLLEKGKGMDAQGIAYAPPIQKPEKIVCIGLNYQEHREEANMGLPDCPALFSKFNNALNAHLASIPLPDGVKEFDYEAELVIVIGKTAHRVSESDAPAHIFGYTAGNDFTSRDLQRRTSQWLLGKTPDGFAPVGPYLVPAEDIDPSHLRVQTFVNGELRQDGNTADMIFSCAFIVSYISQYITLQPGDLIFTGTPKGVILGYPKEKQVWLKAGDKVTVSIEGIGELSNILGTPQQA